jgi:hypothetical protein
MSFARDGFGKLTEGASVAGDTDGLLRFWDTANGRLLWTLPAHKSHLVGVHFEGNDLVTRGFAGGRRAVDLAEARDGHRVRSHPRSGDRGRRALRYYQRT